MRNRRVLYERLFTLHQRLLNGDPTPLGEIARLVYQPLTSMLHQSFPEVDDHILMEKVADAILEYGKKPHQARALAGAGVLGFLILRAQDRVKNELRRDKTRRR